MRRRTLLSAAGTLGAALLAGCTGNGPPASGETTTTTTTTAATTTAASTTTTDSGHFEFDPASDEPFEELAVGSRENVLLPEDNTPHEVPVWNAADRERDIGVLVTDDGETVLDRTVRFPADEYLAIDLLEPASYEVVLSADGETAGTIAVGTGWFDCNDSWTQVGVFPDGRVEDLSVTTEMACAPPQVADHTFEVTGTRCGEQNAGSLDVRERTVALTGRLRTPDPCHGADLSVADSEPGDGPDPADAITLLVSPTEGEEDVCVQCVGEVAYEGTVTFEEAVPEEVVLVHESGGERVEVARL